ncbi:MAG TPA: dihydroxy-acid dehydratase, partial [Conexibacter sp.]
PLRDALTTAAATRAAAICDQGSEYTPIGHVVDERAIANAIVGLLATGGSTNHTMHLLAIAAAAGVRLDWDDFDALSPHVPLLARIYPNGSADVNDFHAAGGTALLIAELLDAGLLHRDVRTVMGDGLDAYTLRPTLDPDERLTWEPLGEDAGRADVLRRVADPFAPDGGLRVLDGALGRAVIKVSAVAPERRTITAPARIFEDQTELIAAFEAGELDGEDFVAVVRFQGPRANGMPELHKLTPVLGVLLDRGQRVALVTDGRMSGASGKVPAAIHCTPEAAAGGPLALLREGDVITLDADRGMLEVLDVELSRRTPAARSTAADVRGGGRELFAGMRALVGPADAGASALGDPAATGAAAPVAAVPA